MMVIRGAEWWPNLQMYEERNKGLLKNRKKIERPKKEKNVKGRLVPLKIINQCKMIFLVV